MSLLELLNKKTEEKEEAREQKMNQRNVAKPPILFNETQQLIKAIEAKLGGSLITYYNSNAGSVCGNDASAMYEILKGKKIQNAFLFIKSDGGSGIASLRIISTLRNYCKNITALVPANCASAATMMALGANEIVMGPLAYLTPVDTSLKHELSPTNKNNELVSVSMDELSRVIKLWKTNEKDKDENPYKSLYEYIHPLVFGAVDRASSLSLKICREILRYHINDDEKIQKISERLNSDYPAHEYPILFREAEEIGLHVKKMDDELNEMLQELTLLYSEMGQRAFTDFDENSYHDNNIANIIEANGKQIYYQIDKDWFYRPDERRWNVMNDESSWRKNELVNGKLKNTIYHLW
ncbi:SDH family Clp fold serine proteinase [Campylobacter sp. MOP51]|uniref:SDH family Clp fold serine proteinase n=1 Tax=Campylobacter canis TaxID=3378588 RepID=UPI003C61EEE4